MKKEGIRTIKARKSNAPPSFILGNIPRLSIFSCIGHTFRNGRWNFMMTSFRIIKRMSAKAISSMLTKASEGA